MNGRNNITSNVNPVLFAILLSLLFVCNVVAGSPSDYYITNVTRTGSVIELNPNFIENETKIVFMELAGDIDGSLPWNYRLVMGDLNGYNLVNLTEPGVIDYRILPGGQKILFLYIKSDIAIAEIDEYDFYLDLKDWQLWELDLKTKAKHLIEKSNGRVLKYGYELLGYRNLRDFSKTEYISHSTEATNAVLIKLEKIKGQARINFYKFGNSGRKELIHSSTSYESVSHIDWLPCMVWVNENSFITVELNNEQNYNKTLNNEEFAIIKIDLAANSKQTLHVNQSAKPFSKLKINDFGTLLYFQQTGSNGLTEIWCLNLNTRNAEKIYDFAGSIGEVRNSVDDSHILFSQVSKNNFDIIRVDIERFKIQRLAGNQESGYSLAQEFEKK